MFIIFFYLDEFFHLNVVSINDYCVMCQLLCPSLSLRRKPMKALQASESDRADMEQLKQVG